MYNILPIFSDLVSITISAQRKHSEKYLKVRLAVVIAAKASVNGLSYALKNLIDRLLSPGAF